MNNPDQQSMFDEALEPLADVVDLASFAERRTANEVEGSKSRHPGFGTTLPPAETILGEPEEVVREWQELRARAKTTGSATVSLSQAEQLKNARRAEATHRTRVPKQVYDPKRR